MAPSFPEIAWHRSVGLLIDSIDRPGFWQAVVGRISDVLHFDNWVALLFQEGRPHLLAESSAPGGGPDPLFQDYLKGIYLIDPFYGVNCETPRSGLIQLRDVAPTVLKRRSTISATSTSTSLLMKSSSTVSWIASGWCTCPLVRIGVTRTRKWGLWP